MVIKLFGMITASLLFCINDGVHAATTSFRVHGQLVMSPCTLSAEASEIDVNMGGWRQETFEMAERGPAVPFVIHLEDCYPQVASTVSVSFSGMRDAQNSTFLGLDSSSTARGVAIALSGQDGKTIDIGGTAYRWSLAAGTNDIPLQAQVVAVSTSVTPGSFSAMAMFELTYP